MPTKKGESLSFSGAAKQIMARQGVRGFYPGLGITVARAFPSNAVMFVCYEQFSRLFGV